MESYNSNNDRPKISLNRKKRMWNRYRNYVIGLIILVVAAIIFAVVLKSCSGKNGGKDDNKSTTAPVKQESTQGVQDETQRSDNSSQEATQQTTQAASGRSLAVSGTPQSEDYTSSAAYGKSVFIGDFVVSGISQFGFVGDSQVVSSNSMTSDKLQDILMILYPSHLILCILWLVLTTLIMEADQWMIYISMRKNL